jgi:DNA-directed RNA polymerase subunit RPC12/RpoP
MNYFLSVEKSVSNEKVCKWKLMDEGMYGCPDIVYKTDCGKSYDADRVMPENFCPNCGKRISVQKNRLSPSDSNTIKIPPPSL